MSGKAAQILADNLVIFAGGTLDLIGLVGNVLVLIILCKQSARSTYVILQAICIADLATLFLHFIFQALALFGKYYSAALRPWTMSVAAIVYYVWPALMVCHNITVWLTALLSLERWLAVCRPLQVRLKLSERRAKWLCVFVFLVAVLYNLPRFYEYEKKCNSSNNTLSGWSSATSKNYSRSLNHTGQSSIAKPCQRLWTRSAIGEHVIYSYFYGVVAYTLLIFFVPVVAILSLNVHLFWEIRRHNTAMKELSLSQRIERKISKMPFCTAVVFCIFETPVTVANIVENCGLVQGKTWSILFAVSSILMLIKATSNILLYFVCASQFRTTLRDILSCCGVTPTSRRISAISQCSFALNSLITNANATGPLLPKRSSSTFSTMVTYERANEQIT